MDLWPKYYHGPRQSITVLRRNRLNLSRAGEHISKHRTLRGAILAAQQDADTRDTNGTYRIRVGGGLLMEFEIVPRADVTIRFSAGTPINAYPTGATISAAASAPSASQIGEDIEVSVNGVAIDGQAAAPAVGTFALLTIPDITVGVGQTHDMSQYILDPLGELETTSIINLNAAYATYDDTTLLLTGVQETPTPQTNVQLEVTYGSNTITGTGFGTIPDAQTPYFEDFEAIALGPTGFSPGSLKVSSTSGTSIVNTDQHTGSQSLKQDFDTNDFPKIYYSLTDAARVYFSCHLKIEGTSASVWKFSRAGGGTEYSGSPRAVFSYGSGSVPGGVGGEVVDSNSILTGSSGNDDGDIIAASTAVQKGTWQFYESEFYTGTEGEPTDEIWAGDSYFQETWDGQDTGRWRNRRFLVGAGAGKLDWILTPINGIDAGSNVVIHMDDIVINEGTRARVVMTDNATYASSTKWAVQPVETWSDTEITYTGKRQGFAINDTAYLHVFDNDGTLVHTTAAITVVAD